MKNFFKSLVVGALLLGSVGCSDMFKEEIYDIYNELDNINARIDSLCNAVNTNIASLQTIIDVMQDNDYVDSITPIVEGGETVGYEIVFTQSGSVKIYHGKKGETGHTPIVGVQQAEDGRWYWTIDGEWLLDGEGDKVLAEAIDGIDGEKGEEGITPKLEVRDNYWYISYDNGATWVQLGKATGENGKDGDSMFKSITYNEDYVELVLADGKTVIKIPTWASHMLLVDEIAKINSNISAIQAAIEALESNDYVQKVTPVKDEDGNVIGYTLQFAFTGDVTIFHGEDGKDGEDGEDGKDGADGEDGKDGKDGYTPVIGARQHPDGNWYWTVDTEWLLDTNGSKVKTTGEDGTSGITPELKIEDDYWYVSYDKGQTWTKLGKAKGEDGADGEGKDGDSFFKDVNVTEDYVTFTLANGTEIKIPTWKVYQELAYAVAHLNTNVQSIQTIIAAIQNNDFVTGTTEIVDPQTNEVIGYKLHFSKSGDIEIYHGKTPNAPKIGIKKHPQYGNCWAYNDQYIYDEAGKPVALPQDGSDAIAPKFKIEGGRWWMSTDGGDSWDDIGQATGDQGQQGETGATGGTGDSFFKNVKSEYATDSEGNVLNDKNGKPIVAYIVLTLSDNSEYRVPTAYITDELTKRIAAIEGEFATIQTIVTALQNAEYIKEITPHYTDLVLDGYDIKFVKYTLLPNGKLEEKYRDVSIRNGGAGAAGTVVGVEADPKTGELYWTLNGEPLYHDGKLVPVTGKTPEIAIKDGYWYINGENTGIKAEGTDGTNGTNGTNASSLFSDVVLNEEGYYEFIFTNNSRPPIKVPSWIAFENLQNAVLGLQTNVQTLETLVYGNKYIESIVAHEDGKGYDITIKYYDPETKEEKTETHKLYITTADEIGVMMNPEDNKYYWTKGGEWLLDADGNKVEVAAERTLVFKSENDGKLYYKYSDEGENAWKVLDISVSDTTIESNIIVTKDDDTGKITVTIKDDEGKTVGGFDCPSWDAYLKLQNAVTSLTNNVETISALVYGHKYVESFKELENGGYEFVVRYYDETDKEWETETHTIDVTTADEIGVKQDTDGNYYWTKGGEWLLDANGEKVKVAAERTLQFKSENDGKLYYKYSDESENDWKEISIAVSDTTIESNIIVVKDEVTGKVTVTIKDDEGRVVNGFEAPMWSAYEKLLVRMETVEGLVATIQEEIAGLSASLETLSEELAQVKENQNKYLTSEEFDTWKSETNFVQNVALDGDILKITIVNGNGENPEEIEYPINHPVSTYKNKDGELYWLINGEETKYPVESKPKFRVTEAGNLEFSFDGEDWTALESASNATVTVKFATAIAEDGTYTSCDAKDALWAGIYYGEDNIIWMPTYKNFNELVATVEAIANSVEALVAIVEENAVITNVTPSENGFTATAVKYELNYDENGNLVKGTDGKYYTVAESKTITYEDTAISIEQDPKSMKWYWVVNGVKTELMGTGFIPQVHTADGFVYISISADATTDNLEEGWIKVAQTNTVATYVGTDETGYTITFGGNQDSINVPSLEMFNDVLTTVSNLDKSVGTINTLLTGFNQFVKSVEEIKSEGQLVGFKVVTAKYENNTWSDIISYYYDNLLVKPVKENDAWFWYIYTVTMADGGTFSYGDPVKIPFDGTFVPKIKYEAGAIYVSMPTSKDDDLSTWTKLGSFADVQLGGISQQTLNVTQDDTSVTFKFGTGETTSEVKVVKYMPSPNVEFTADHLDFTTLGEDELENGFAKVEFSITGSFASEYKAEKIFATCEGNWISKGITWGTAKDGVIEGHVYVKPTTAYEGDNTDGKLTVYIPYYGTTGIGQMTMSAGTTAQIEIKNLDAEDVNMSIAITAHPSLNLNPSTNPFRLSFQPINKDDSCDWIKAGTLEFNGESDSDVMAYTQNLSVERNYTGQSRSCYVHVYSPDGRKISKVKVEQDTFDFTTVTNLADVDKTGEEDPANCYIISQPGYYKFPVVKGNTNTRVVNGDDLTKDIFGDTHINGGNNPVDILVYDDNYVYFKVDAASINPGNSLITVKDGNNVAWSWHLWFCSSTPGTLEAINGEESLMMDRNLGAIASEVDFSLGTYKIDIIWKEGLYYQWGRKDPLLAQTPKSGGTYEKTKANPSVLYSDWDATDEGAGWNESKSLNDPCPPGYKIPSSEQWKGTGDDVYKFEELITHSMLDINYYVYDVQINNPENVVLFNYGYLDENNGQRIYLHENVVRSGTVPNGEYASTTAIDGLTMNGAIRYTNANFTLTSNEKFGALWNSDSKTSLYYSYLKPTKVTVNSGTKEKFSGFLIGSWKTDKLTPGETQTDANLLMDFRNYITTYSPEYQISPAAGLQVRCVKEVKE